MILVLFWTLAVGGCGYAAALGGKDGRWAAILILSASVLSVPAILLGAGWLRTETALTVVDLGLLVGLYWLSLRSRRYFPIWMTESSS